MSVIIARAAKGNIKAKLILLDVYKDKIYSLCRVLLNDTAKAEQAAERVINRLWDRLGEMGELSESRMLERIYIQTAAECKNMLFTPEDLKINGIVKSGLINYRYEVYDGDMLCGIELVQRLLSDAHPLQRFVYLLNKAAGLSASSISVVIKQRESVAKQLCYQAEHYLTDVLSDKAEYALTLGQCSYIISFSTYAYIFPESACDKCKSIIEERKEKARTQKTPPALIVVISLILVFIGVVTAIAIGMETSEAQDGYYGDTVSEESR